MNHPELSEAMFDSRNTQLYRFDRGLLDDYDKNQQEHNTNHNLIIFHLLGQHVKYKQRFPSDRRHFKAEDYAKKRADLDGKQRQMLADYDNAVLYNDSIVDAIMRVIETSSVVNTQQPLTMIWHTMSLKSHSGSTVPTSMSLIIQRFSMKSSVPRNDVL